MPLILPTDQKQLAALVDRRHPAYAAKLAHWEFCRATYDGGRDWFEHHLFKYLKEGEGEFGDRKKRAYRFNHTREVVNLVTKYIFKSDVIRNRDEAPDALKKFWRSATRDGLGIDTLMQRICGLGSVFGRIWVGTDTVVPAGVVTKADEKAGLAKVYAYTVSPENLLDFARSEDNELLWVMFRVTHRDDEDPVESSGVVVPRYVIWTREEYVILEERRLRGKRMINEIKRGPNNIGVVPLFEVDDRESDDPYDVPGLIDDIAYLDRAIANYLSNLDAIIQDQTFSQLVIPAQGLMPGEAGYNQLVEMGTKRIFSYDGEAGKEPHYISPDPKQAAVILAIINKIIAEIYHSVGMAGERTKQDNAVGIDNSSGVAKAYDFERVNSLLASKADVLERVEDRLAAMVALWTGVTLVKDEDGETKDLVKYPDSFDVRGLYDEFEIAEQFALIQAPDELRREQLRALVDKLFPRLAAAIKEKIEAGIAAWPPDPIEQAAKLAAATAPAAQPGADKPALGGGRQGQVTDKTKANPKGSSPKPANRTK